MQLGCDAISTTSRPRMMFSVEHGFNIGLVNIDPVSGEHLDSTWRAVNPGEASARRRAAV